MAGVVVPTTFSVTAPLNVVIAGVPKFPEDPPHDA
jgi:hypothetical protein